MANLALQPRSIFLLITLFVLTPSAFCDAILSADHPGNWTAEQLAQPIAAHTLHNGRHSSVHRIRLRAKEPPHVHDHHDLTVFVLSGDSVMHLANGEHPMHAGDFVHIPAGTPHWAENTDPEASEVMAVFSPPFDGKDRRAVDWPPQP
jgi:quercetin dioxygenase-like cupin family protein